MCTLVGRARRARHQTDDVVMCGREKTLDCADSFTGGSGIHATVRIMIRIAADHQSNTLHSSLYVRQVSGNSSVYLVMELVLIHCSTTARRRAYDCTTQLNVYKKGGYSRTPGIYTSTWLASAGLPRKNIVWIYGTLAQRVNGLARMSPV